MNEQTPTPNTSPVVPPAAPQPAPAAVPVAPVVQAPPVAVPVAPVAAPVAQPAPVSQPPVQAPAAARPVSTAPVVRPPAAPGTRPMRTVVVVKKKRVGWLTGVVIVLLAALSWFYVQRLNDLEAAQKLIEDAARQAAAAEELLKNREKPAPVLTADQKSQIFEELTLLRGKTQIEAWLKADFGSGKKPDFATWQPKRDAVNKQTNDALAARSNALAQTYGVSMSEVVVASRSGVAGASALSGQDPMVRVSNEAVTKGIALLGTGDAVSFASAFEQFALAAELQNPDGTAFVAKLSPYLTKAEVQKLKTLAKNLAKAVRGEPVVQVAPRSYAKRTSPVEAETVLPPPAQDGSWITAGNTWLAMPEKPKPTDHAAAPEEPEEFKGHTLPTEKKGIDQTAITPANKRSIRAGAEWYDGAEPLHSASGPQCPCDE